MFHQWDHRRETDSSDGFLGTINQARKTLTAKVRLPHSPSSATVSLTTRLVLQLTAAFVDSEAPKA